MCARIHRNGVSLGVTKSARKPSKQNTSNLGGAVLAVGGGRESLMVRAEKHDRYTSDTVSRTMAIRSDAMTKSATRLVFVLTVLVCA